MKSFYAIIAALLFASFNSEDLLAQSTVATSNNGPSLEVTMNYIRDRLSGARLQYSVDDTLSDSNDAENECEIAAINASGTKAYGQSKPKPPCPTPVPTWFPERYSITEVQADAASCSFAFHHKVSQDRKYAVNFGVAENFSFKNVNAIKVTSLTEVMKQILTDPVSGQPWTLNYSPSVYAVRIKMNSGKKVHQRNDDGNQEFETDFTYVPFLDEELANSFAKAMNHAAELCGAVNNDPFK